MNKVFNPEKNTWSSLAKRPLYSLDSVKGIVDEIFTNVKLYGDRALIDYTNKFDKVDLNDLIVSDQKINKLKSKILNYCLKIIVCFFTLKFFNLIKYYARVVAYIKFKK